ncbi:MAG: tetratricopeptide repeat protein [Bacteroidetes bacterium]|nr:tetratricopeptide repeat protein [Bacteroidota bacterium]
MISRGIFRRSGWLAFLAIATVSIFGLSCSNTKDSLWTRTFHNLSAHYNGYYNAGLKLEEGTDKLAISHEDKYDRILKVFQYANAEKSKAIYPLMDDAMKRTSNVIARHTIIDKNGNEKPNSEKWIDENWLLYGKGLFFKHDYFEAMEAFKYVEVTYKKETTRHLGSLWIAKTYLELTQLKEAEDKLDYLRNQGDFPKKNKWELAAVNADFYLQTKNYPKAIESLTKASILAPKREDRIRFMFILAQLHQQQEEYQKAFQLYTKVIKMNPKYEMAFNARINRARCFDANSKNGDEVKKELAKLQKDPKNKDFLDQIYYALAGLAKKEGKPDEEFENLNKSVRASTTNQNQKALSYLELAKIYFTKPDYKTHRPITTALLPICRTTIRITMMYSPAGTASRN